MALIISLPMPGQAVTPVELQQRADSLFQSGQTGKLESLFQEHHLLVNSTTEITLDKYLAFSAIGKTGDREKQQRFLEFLYRQGGLSVFHSGLVRKVLDRWSSEDIARYARGKSLLKNGVRQSTEHWRDSLALAIDIFESLGHQGAVAETQYAIADRYYSHEKRYDSAQVHFLLAEMVERNAGNIDRLCKILTGCANSRYRLAEGAAEAIVRVEEAIKIAHEAKLHSRLIDCNNALGAIYYYLNEYQAASVRFRVSDSICQANSLPEKRQYPLSVLSHCLEKLGDSKAADSVRAVAADLTGGAEKRETALVWEYTYEANDRIDTGDTIGIRSNLVAASIIAKGNGDQTCLAQVMYLLGRLNRLAGNHRQSESQLRLALGQFSDIKDRVYPAKELGLCYLDCGNLDSAEVYLDSAKAMLIAARSDVPRSTFRHRYLTDKYDLITALVTLTLRRGDPSRALDLAEEFRAQSLRESMLETTLGKDMDGEKSSAVARIDEEIASLIKGVRLCANPEADLSLITERLERLNDSVVNIRLMHAGRSPVSPSAIRAGHADFAATSTGNKMGLYYFVHGENVFVWYSIEGKIHFEDISKDHPAILEDVRRAVERLSRRPVSRGDQKTLDSLLANLPPLVPERFRSLIDSTDILQIYPMGVLSYFPFETIKCGDNYLGQLVSIEYYPCLSVHKFLMNTETSVDRLRSIALFGGTFESSSEGCDHQDSGFALKYTSLSSLPGVADEVTTIKSLFGGRFTDFVNRFRQEEILRGADFGNVDILHFATHGIILDEYPEFSSLLLPVNESSGSDEVIRMSEISSRTMATPLVVLSACRSGFGQYVTGEGIMGFSRAFIVGGARSVVVSLWPVDDKASGRYFAEPFYRALLEGQSTAESLRAVRKSMINSPLFSDPYYWAPFVAYGNWQ